jgi:hypothetical protein
MIIRYSIAWTPLVFIAILNGAIREYVYGPHVTELHAHQISTFTGIILSGFYVWALSYFWPLNSDSEAVIVGLFWFGLTIAFEFLFGHYVAGHSWERLLYDYNLLAGRLWLIFLIWIATAPYLFYHLRK